MFDELKRLPQGRKQKKRIIALQLMDGYQWAQSEPSSSLMEGRCHR